jgi:hypothetical protein
MAANATGRVSQVTSDIAMYAANINRKAWHHLIEKPVDELRPSKHVSVRIDGEWGQLACSDQVVLRNGMVFGLDVFVLLEDDEVEDDSISTSARVSFRNKQFANMFDIDRDDIFKWPASPVWWISQEAEATLPIEGPTPQYNNVLLAKQTLLLASRHMYALAAHLYKAVRKDSALSRYEQHLSQDWLARMRAIMTENKMYFSWWVPPRVTYQHRLAFPLGVQPAEQALCQKRHRGTVSLRDSITVVGAVSTNDYRAAIRAGHGNARRKGLQGFAKYKARDNTSWTLGVYIPFQRGGKHNARYPVLIDAWADPYQLYVPPVAVGLCTITISVETLENHGLIDRARHYGNFVSLQQRDWQCIVRNETSSNSNVSVFPYPTKYYARSALNMARCIAWEMRAKLPTLGLHTTHRQLLGATLDDLLSTAWGPHTKVEVKPYTTYGKTRRYAAIDLNDLSIFEPPLQRAAIRHNLAT